MTSSISPAPPAHTRAVTIRSLVLSLLLALGLVFSVQTSAHANTFYEAGTGRDYLTTSTTLYFQNAHGNFNLRIYVQKSNWNSGSDRYSVNFYDNAGRNVWSASNQGDQIWGVGGNVTRIVIQRDNRVASAATTFWQRQ